jgi:hypothetical protein
MRSQSVLKILLVMFAGTAAMVVQAAPAPQGHDQVLRRLIEDAAKGQIRYQTLEPDLAAAIRPQAAAAQSELLALGALKSIAFESADAGGVEIY